MANFDLLTVVSGKQKRAPSSTSVFDFSSVRVGADNLAISQTGSGGSAYLDLNSRKLRGVSTPLSSELDAVATVDFVLNVAPQLMSWQNAVLDNVTTPPGSPATGSRYLIGLNTGAAVATGAFAGHDGQIAQYNGTAWSFHAPVIGDALSVDTNNNGIYLFTGTLWVFKSFGVSYTASNGIKAVGTDYQRDDALSFSNANAGAISAGQVVYLNSTGQVDLALASAITNTNQLGVVQDVSIASAASGLVVVREGAVVGGYTGLTPGALCYVDRTTAGALTQSLAGFVAGEAVYAVGRALSATQVLLDPQFQYEN